MQETNMGDLQYKITNLESEISTLKQWIILAKAQTEGKQLQYAMGCDEWEDAMLTQSDMMVMKPRQWRIKPEVEFPVYRRHKFEGYIVRFDSEEKGTVVMSSDKNGRYKIGFTSNEWIPYDDIFWEEVLTVTIDGETYYDTQPVWAWDNNDKERYLEFFDAVNQCAFKSDGTREGMGWDHYAPVKCIEDWMVEQWEELER